MAVRATVAHGTTSDWAASTIPLALGQIGEDTVTGELRVGDGNTLWAGLPVQVRTRDGSVKNIQKMTQAAYSALASYDPTTLYVIVG